MCGSPFTAGWSKGAKEYYLYYRCVKHSNINIPGSRLHEEFNKILKALSFQPQQILFLQDGVTALSKVPLKQKHQQTTEKMLALKEINDKIMQLEERYMNNEVETSTYKTWFKKLTEEKSELELAMKPKFRQNDYAEKSIGRTLPHLKNLFQIFELCNIYQKHAIVRALFKDNLAYGGGMFRTNFIDPTFIANALEMNKKGLLDYEQSFQFSDKIPISTVKEDYFEHLNRFLLLIEPIIEDLERKKII